MFFFLSAGQVLLLFLQDDRFNFAIVFYREKVRGFARYEQAPGSHTEREEGSQKEADKTQMSREPAY